MSSGKQKTGETIDAFHTRLRQLATTCEFSNPEREIKSQIILTCSSSRLRRRALRDSSLTLKQLLDLARAFEMSETQAAGIENNTQVNSNERVAAIPKPNFKKKTLNKSQQQKTVKKPKKTTVNMQKLWWHFSTSWWTISMSSKRAVMQILWQTKSFCTLLFQQTTQGTRPQTACKTTTKTKSNT